MSEPLPFVFISCRYAMSGNYVTMQMLIVFVNGTRPLAVFLLQKLKHGKNSFDENATTYVRFPIS